MKKITFLLFCLFIGVGLVTAQTTRVTGTVTSADDGEPVIGASVMAKGTTIGTVTDFDGKFELNVPTSAKTLVISYVGMTTQEVAPRPTMTIVLQTDAQALDEVMVVAYGTAKRSAYTGSASVLKSADIGKVQTTNVANALAGRVSGVQMSSASGQPGTTSPAIRIRGITSINAGNNPLIILDGIPFDGDMNHINSQDIESLTVLKDAASNALYGARGANGVIIITTKKGASGQARVTVDAKWGSNSRATQDYKLVKDPAQYYEMHYGALKNYFENTMEYTSEDAYVLANQNLAASNDYGLAYNVYSTPAGQYLIGTNGKLNPNSTLGNVVTYRGKEYLLTPDDWLDEAYKKSLRQEYNVSVAAGSDKSTFYASANYLDVEGITPNSDFKRLTANLKADYQANSWLKVGGHMMYTNYEANSLGEDGASNSSGNVFAIATQVAPIYPLYIRDGQGNVMYDDNGIKMYDYANGGNAGLQRPIFATTNALSNAILDTNVAEGNAFYANGFAEIRFLEDFKFTSINSTLVNETRTTSVTNPFYGSYASSKGIVYKYHTRTHAYNFQQLLNYTKAFDLHNVSVMVGHEYNKRDYVYLYASKSNMFDPTNHELAGAVVDGSQHSYLTEYNTEGFFTRGQYDYDDKYFASVSFRRDATSRFHPDNRWGNFWSFGGAWNMSKERWFDVSWVDMLKVKASYGEQGNDNIGNFRYTNTYDIVNSSGSAAAVPLTMGNKDITWETNANFNAGADFDLFNSRLTGTLEYFLRKSSDMLFSFPLPPSYGYTSYYANIGDMRNMGLELELNGTVMKTQDFNWDARFNFTFVKNKITYLPEERKTMTTSDGVDGYATGNYFHGEGIPLHSFYIPKYAGVNEEGESLFYKDVLDAEGNVTGRETTKVYSEASDYLCGTAMADVYGGFGTSLSYKGFDFGIDFAYQLGGQVLDTDYLSAMMSPTKSFRGSAFHADLLDAWTPENASSNIPRMQYGDDHSNARSDRFLISASYLSLQNINAGYTLPSRLCKPLGVEKLRVYLACDNVWLWSKRQGLDPRQSITGTSTASYYAPIRTISGGITVTF